MKSLFDSTMAVHSVLVLGGVGVALGALTGGVAGSEATGPLHVSRRNPRYFADAAGRVVYLTGAHTWNNLQDMGPTDPPPPFDFTAYLDFLVRHHHNFIRLWTWGLTRYSYQGAVSYCQPFPWPRTGPGNALDGKPRFDLSRFNEAYFTRLRRRVTAAGQRGIYVSLMLFEGHGLHASDAPWCWNGSPFHGQNNVNGIDGDRDGNGRGIEIQTLEIPPITKIQEAYVRKVIDTVGDLDNVLYEICNESGTYSTKWQYHFIRFIHEYERTRPKQHPVGMTFQFCREAKLRGTNKLLFDSPAEWISPNPQGGYRDNPPAAVGSKVILTDTDHLWGIGGNVRWVWKSFCRGLNPLFMDPYRRPQKDTATAWVDHLGGATLDPAWEPLRRNLGYARRFADRMDLAEATPHNRLASTRYCLAAPGSEYLVYLPEGGEVSVDLSAAKGTLTAEWFNPASGKTEKRLTVQGGATQALTAPFPGPAVLYLKKK